MGPEVDHSEADYSGHTSVEVVEEKVLRDIVQVIHQEDMDRGEVHAMKIVRVDVANVPDGVERQRDVLQREVKRGHLDEHAVAVDVAEVRVLVAL